MREWLSEQQRAQERDPNGLMGQSQPKLVVLTGGSIPACMYPHTKLPFSSCAFHRFLFLETKKT